jgi:cytochrome c
MMTKTLIVAVALIATSTDAGMAQDVAKGEILFKKCVICHSIGPGAQNKVGPAQNGLDGRKAGSVLNYQYSDANKNSGIVWNEVTFKEYIKDPKAKIPGTKMVFAGIKNDQEINDLWAYLKQFDANGNINKMPTVISKSDLAPRRTLCRRGAPFSLKIARVTDVRAP